MSLIFIGYDAIGDYISYNGMIRFLADKYDNVIIVTTYNNFVSLLFRDNQKIKNINFYDYNELIRNQNNFDIIDARIGEKYFKPYTVNGIFYDKDNKIGKLTNQSVNDNASSFYSSLGLPIEMRIENFHFERLINEEDTLYKSITGSTYSVICEYTGCYISKDYINNKNCINLHRLSPNMLDIIKIIENAEEVHLVENSIALLVYHMQSSNLMKNIKVNLHAYSRKENHRLCNSENCNNFYLNMLLYPKLKNWNFIYE